MFHCQSSFSEKRVFGREQSGDLLTIVPSTQHPSVAYLPVARGVNELAQAKSGFRMRSFAWPGRF